MLSVEPDFLGFFFVIETEVTESVSVFACYLEFRKILNTLVFHRITGVFLLYPSSGILKNRNTAFRKLHLFPSPGEGGEDTYSVGPLRKS
jgi:hypothetical protein